MPIFNMTDGQLSTISLTDFATERELQRLVEANLEVTFGCSFVASEFSTGSVHSGRIDTLALSEDGNPVIIEYKKVASASLINQALFYLDWIKDHHGDFEIAARQKLGEVAIDWSAIRVICLAPQYDNYSVHAVRHMSAGIELWRYRYFANNTVELEEVFRSTQARNVRTSAEPEAIVDAKVVESPVYTIAAIQAKGSTETLDLFERVHEHLLSLDDAIDVVPKKLYIAYKLARNLACIEIQRRKVVITLNRKAYDNMPSNFIDVTNVGHWGTGDIEVHVGNEAELETALQGISEAYKLAGGN